MTKPDPSPEKTASANRSAALSLRREKRNKPTTGPDTASIAASATAYHGHPGPASTFFWPNRHFVWESGTTWRVVIPDGTDPATGRRRRIVRSGFTDEKTATRALHKLLTDLEQQTYVGKSRLTVREYLADRWMPAHRREIRPNTAAIYDTTIAAYILPHIGAVLLQDLTAPDVSALYGKLEASGGQSGRPLSPKTVRNVHLVLHKAFEDAVGWEMLKRNPAASAKPPTAKKARPAASSMTTWDDVQVREFLEVTADDRLSALWRLAFLTGMRRSEILGLGWSSVNDETIAVVRTLVEVAGQPQFGEPKTDRSRRTISIDPVTSEQLRTHRKRQLEERMRWGEGYEDSGLVFTRENGSPIRPAWLSRRFVELVKGTALPHMGIHGARHSWATNALRAGLPTKLVSAQLGHSSIAVTGDIYQHVTDDLSYDAAVRMADLYDVGT